MKRKSPIRCADGIELVNRFARNHAQLRMATGGEVPGTGHGDKIPAKYEPGEFVVSNDMLDAQPGLREGLRDLRGRVLAEKGMTPAQADAKALRYAGQGDDDGSQAQNRKTQPDELESLGVQGSGDTRSSLRTLRGLPKVELHAQSGGGVDWSALTNQEITKGNQFVNDFQGVKDPDVRGAIKDTQSLMKQPAGEAARYAAPTPSAQATPKFTMGQPASMEVSAPGLAAEKLVGNAEAWKPTVDALTRSRSIPGLSTIGKLAKPLAAPISGYQTVQDLNNGDYSNAALHGADTVAGGALFSPAAPAASVYLGARAAYGAPQMLRNALGPDRLDTIGGTINEIGLRTGLWGDRDAAHNMAAGTQATTAPLPRATSAKPVAPQTPTKPVETLENQSPESRETALRQMALALTGGQQAPGTTDPFTDPQGLRGNSTVVPQRPPVDNDPRPTVPTYMGVRDLNNTVPASFGSRDEPNNTGVQAPSKDLIGNRAATDKASAALDAWEARHPDAGLRGSSPGMPGVGQDNSGPYPGVRSVGNGGYIPNAPNFDTPWGRSAAGRAQQGGLAAGLSPAELANNQSQLSENYRNSQNNMVNILRANNELKRYSMEYNQKQEDLDTKAKEDGWKGEIDRIKSSVPKIGDQEDTAEIARRQDALQKLLKSKADMVTKSMSALSPDSPEYQKQKLYLQGLERRGPAMLSPQERDAFHTDMALKHVIRNSATGSLNPMGTTNVDDDEPITYLMRQPGALGIGNDYVDNRGRTIPGRFIEKSNTTMGMGGIRNNQFLDLIAKGDQESARRKKANPQLRQGE